MRSLVFEGPAEQHFRLVDPDSLSEAELEALVVRTLAYLYPGYLCRVFTGSFLHEGNTSRPDLALVARDCSHWFVVEVELVSHSLHGHVLPQVRALRYGEPQSDCSGVLARELDVTVQQAETLLWRVPRTVAVIANKLDHGWAAALGGVPVQYAAISVYRSAAGCEALGMDGTLEAVETSLGFGRYSATDRSLRFPSTVELPTGSVQIGDPGGGVGTWTVRRDGIVAWITKDTGVPSLPDGVLVQLTRGISGRTLLRVPGVFGAEVKLR